jgi:HAMP domain-containing protein
MKLNLSRKVFLLIAVLLSIQTGFLYYFSEKVIETVLLDESRKQAQVFLLGLEREVLSSPDYEDREFLQKKIDRAVSEFPEFDFSIYRLYVFNQKGEILADSLKNRPKTKEIKEYMLPVFLEGETFIGQEIEYKPGLGDGEGQSRTVAITDIIIPMRKDGRVVAAIEAEINIENALKNIRKVDSKYDSAITLSILVSGALFMLFLWLFLKRDVLSPIQEIDKTARAIAKGDLESRIHLKGGDEMSRLGRSINTMAASLQEYLDKQEQAYIQVLQSLAKALEAKDPYTAGHSSRVAKFSVKLGRYLGLSEEEMGVLKQGALMHDLGKIAIPDRILNKPDKLTDEEFEIMRSHPKKTADIMKPLRHYAKHREIAAWHHERWDGKGYPDGLKGEQIPLLARIVSIADTWDAMTGDRVYRKGISEEKALSILSAERDSGQWDPELIDAFINMMTNKEQ